MFKYSDRLIQMLLKGIYGRQITQRNLPVSLYLALADHLKEALYNGYGATYSSLKKVKKPKGFSTRDLELMKELRTNIYLFSAAKTYQQVRTMSSALMKNGKVVPFKEFREKATETYGLYNKVWLQTEYDTAIGQAQMARKWQMIETNKDVLPLLEYSAVIDSRTSEICKPLDGIIAPVNDPIWKKIAPLNHFNCRCLLLQREDGKVTNEAIKKSRVAETEAMMQDLFKMNAGMDGYVFSKEHPYFDVAPKDRALARKNFNLPIPEKDKK